MSEQPEFTLPKDMEGVIQAIFPHPTPDPAFVDRLERQLSAQVDQSTTKQRRLQALMTPLAWVGAGVVLILILILLINGLLPHNEPGQIIPGGTGSPTSGILPSPTSELSGHTRTQESPTVTPEATMPPNLYPNPSPFLTPMNGLSASGCPNMEGIESSGQLSLDEAFQVLQALNSGQTEAMRQVSDPTFWDYFYFPTNGTPTPIEKDWLEVKPASQSEYSILIEAACGQSMVEVSWSVVNCGAPCQTAQSPALFSHYFLINRNGTWLIWASYP